MITTRSKDIVFLLGAGASAEAGIPTSEEMIEKIEILLTQDKKWKIYFDLYNHVKSAIHYSAGLRGKFNDEVNYNIETLVNTLYELERNEDHPLYPFIAAWNSRFVALAKPDFSDVQKFRHLILEALKKWMSPVDSSQSDYYFGLARLQQDLNFPLPIFTLNYDLCVERLNKPDFRVETGFEGFGPQYAWDWERFEDTSSNPPPQIMLYKLHGSINWKREESTKQLLSFEQTENVESDKMEVIFGKDFKLEAADPYLFYAYEFRRYTLMASLIVIIGYGFSDTHINKMLAQGLRDDSNRRLLVIHKLNSSKEQDKKEEIGRLLELAEDEKNQVTVRLETAKDFFEKSDLSDFLKESLPNDSKMPF